MYTNHTLKHKPMKQKEMYASPETEVMDFKLEGVIAASDFAVPGFEDGGDLDSLF